MWSRKRGTGRIDEHGNTSGSGHQLTQEFESLRHQLSTEKLIPVRLPPGLARLATRPTLTGCRFRKLHPFDSQSSANQNMIAK